MFSLSTKSEIENDSFDDYEISSTEPFYNIREKYENSNFEKAFSSSFNNKENLNNINHNSEEDNNFENFIKENYTNDIYSIKKNNNKNNDNILLGRKTGYNYNKFIVNKINSKREIAFITFNTKFNKYLTEKVNKKIDEIGKKSIFYFTNENPLLSTKFTQCGIQKTLKKYLECPIKEFIKKENFTKICEIGLENNSIFNSLIYELIIDYYEFIYCNKEEFNKFLYDKKFVIRNEKFSKDGLINLKYSQNNKKVYGYLDFFKIDINLKRKERKDKNPRFSILLKE